MSLAASAVVQGTMIAMANTSRNMADNIAPACAADGPLGSRSSPAVFTRLNSSAVSATAPTAAKIERMYATMKISRICSDTQCHITITQRNDGVRA
ncbi:hypothetical protein ACFQ0B_58770 [Nonomuraea thailandensis]